jgi:CMP-N,N'-diacetyllegionaminic acid synthase
MSVLAIIPARSGSKGCPGKNFRTLGDRTLVGWAAKAAREAGITERWVSSDVGFRDVADGFVRHLWRPPELAQDDTPMIAVVQHALAQVPGPEDQIIVLLQPTQPFRTPEHVRQAMALLQETQADSVVSVVELPASHHPEYACHIMDRQLYAIQFSDESWSCYSVSRQPTRRQDVGPVYRRDGTVYACWRKTVSRHGTIYGEDVRPLIIPPEESCELDTEADWQAVETRWNAQHGQA